METPTDHSSAFARIQGEVEAGKTDLRSLGFWRLVEDVKRDPQLAERFAETIARIDRLAFERSVRLRFPLWLGHGIAIVALAVLVALVPAAVFLARGDKLGGILSASPGVAGLLVVVAAGGLSVALHAPAHWLVGRLAGIRFTGWFVGGPLRVTPGVKIEYASYLRASPRGRAVMHAAGALASKIAPFAVFVPVYLIHRGEGYELFPAWSLWAILGFALAQIVTDIVWSTKASDWKKVRRELRSGAASSI